MWLGTSACMERITVRCRRCTLPTCENLTDFDPVLTVTVELEGRPKNGSRSALGDQVHALLGNSWPWYRSRAGLGSKVSTWDGPPFWNR